MLPDLRNLPALAIEATLPLATFYPQPPPPAMDGSLRARLEAARTCLPAVYRARVVDPVLAALKAGARAFVGTAEGRVLGELVQAILQRAEASGGAPLAALQEVVADLYDGFLSAEDRRGIKRPDRGVAAPLVKWGQAPGSPYIFGAPTIERVVGASVGLVNMPASNAWAGLASWAAISHETAGHGILLADDGLLPELRAAVQRGLVARGHGQLAGFWARRVDEAAADVMSALNLGPAAGIGAIAHFRASAGLGGGPMRLGSTSPPGSVYPAALLRGWSIAATVGRLRFAGADAWSRALWATVGADCLGPLLLDGAWVDPVLAADSASTVAAVLAGARLASLEGHALEDIQNWSDDDEAIAGRLVPALLGGAEVEVPDGCYAAHAVAAALVAAAAAGGQAPALFRGMLPLLAAMHVANPVWNDSGLLHRGDAVTG